MVEAQPLRLPLLLLANLLLAPSRPPRARRPFRPPPSSLPFRWGVASLPPERLRALGARPLWHTSRLRPRGPPFRWTSPRARGPLLVRPLAVPWALWALPQPAFILRVERLWLTGPSLLPLLRPHLPLALATLLQGGIPSPLARGLTWRLPFRRRLRLPVLHLLPSPCPLAPRPTRPAPLVPSGHRRRSPPLALIRWPPPPSSLNGGLLALHNPGSPISLIGAPRM